jgi:hypothetical protein
MRRNPDSSDADRVAARPIETAATQAKMVMAHTRSEETCFEMGEAPAEVVVTQTRG